MDLSHCLFNLNRLKWNGLKIKKKKSTWLSLLMYEIIACTGSKNLRFIHQAGVFNAMYISSISVLRMLYHTLILCVGGIRVFVVLLHFLSPQLFTPLYKVPCLRVCAGHSQTKQCKTPLNLFPRLIWLLYLPSWYLSKKSVFCKWNLFLVCECVSVCCLKLP